MELQNRKNIRIPDFDYGQNGAYFITICAKDRNKIFWSNVGADIIRPKDITLSDVGKIAEQGILQTEKHYSNIKIEKYVIMPDHIHFILVVDNNQIGRMVSAPTVSTIIGSMKRWVSKQVGEPIWQKSFYDHVIRNQNDYNEIWEYIDNNPKKWLMERIDF